MKQRLTQIEPWCPRWSTRFFKDIVVENNKNKTKNKNKKLSYKEALSNKYKDIYNSNDTRDIIYNNHPALLLKSNKTVKHKRSKVE